VSTYAFSRDKDFIPYLTYPTERRIFMLASFVPLRLHDMEDNQIIDCCFFFILEEVFHHLVSSADDFQKQIRDLN